VIVVAFGEKVGRVEKGNLQPSRQRKIAFDYFLALENLVFLVKDVDQ
jgi:hypothetical protein